MYIQLNNCVMTFKECIFILVCSHTLVGLHHNFQYQKLHILAQETFYTTEKWKRKEETARNRQKQIYLIFSK